MASNLETIGLGVRTEQEFEDLVHRLAREAEEGLSTPAGDYAVWRSRSGAEVWLHIAKPDAGGEEPSGPEAGGPVREIRGLTPFFGGESAIDVNVTAQIKRPNDNEFEGAFQAWVAPGDDPADEGAYPLVFDAVDFAAFANQPLPARGRVRIAGFSRELKAFPDEAAFAAANASGPGFAAQSFFPVGLLAEAEANDGAVSAPSSNALINGIVRRHMERTNELTGQPYHWLEVESLAASYDIIAAPGVVSGEITEGGVVQAACWLFGRMLA